MRTRAEIEKTTSEYIDQSKTNEEAQSHILIAIHGILLDIRDLLANKDV